MASAIGHGLVSEYGIEKGDRVAICMRNYPEWIIAFEAITSTGAIAAVSYTHLRAHETVLDLVCRLLLEKKKKKKKIKIMNKIDKTKQQHTEKD